MSVRLGFELEMLAPYSRDTFVKKIADDLGFDIANADRGRIRNYDRWFVVNDGSIQGGGRTHVGHELISPPMDREAAMEALQKVFAWMSINQCITNNTTGLHVGISFKDANRMGTIDKFKLVSLLDEAGILRKFGRSNNSYCKNTFNATKSAIKNSVSHAVAYSKVGYIPTKIEDLSKFVKVDKYHFVNLSKMDRGYIEFRALGGENYHTRWEDISHAINHFIEAMEESTSKEPNRKYEGKAKTILKSVKAKAVEGFKTYADTTQSELRNMERMYAERLRLINENLALLDTMED